MSAAWPRMMRERTAKRYLDGLDPFQDYGVAPEFQRGEPYYDRVAVDRALDARLGLTPPPESDDPESALSTWVQGRHGAAARRP